MPFHAESIHLDKRQTIFLVKDGTEATWVQSGTVEEIGSLLAQHTSKGCEIHFTTRHAPNFKRCFNAHVKRAKRIADAAGVQLSDPQPRFVQGYAFDECYSMFVL